MTMFYDPEFSKINAKQHEERMIRLMQDGQEDAELIGKMWQNLNQAIRNQFRSAAKSTQPAPIGNVQANPS